MQRIIGQLRSRESRYPYIQYHYLFMHRDRQDYLDLRGTVAAVETALTYVAAGTGVSIGDLFTDVVVYGRSADAWDDISVLERNPAWTDVSRNDMVSNKPIGRELREREKVAKLKVFSEVMNQRAAEGHTALPRNITEHLLPQYMLRDPTKYTKRVSRRSRRLRSERRRRTRRLRSA